MAEAIVTITHQAGLHARPLAQFVNLAKQFEADVQVWNTTRNTGPAAGNSPIKLMLLAIGQGHQIKIHAEGPQAQEALGALVALVERNFRGMD